MNKSSKPVTCFLSFADSRMSAALARIEEQARAMKCFDKIRIYNEEKLDAVYRDKMKHHLLPSVRGFGYWCWKSHIIHTTLKELPENAVLLYSDAGCHLNPNGIERLRHYFDELGKSPLGIKAFTTCSAYIDTNEKRWTKGDVFDFFNCRNDTKITDTPQIAATIILCRKCPAALAFLDEWKSVVHNYDSLLDDSPSTSHDMNGYIEHRHDQSIFSVLFKLKGGIPLPEGEIENFKDEEKDQFPFWALRDKGYKDMRFFSRVKRYLKGVRLRIKIKYESLKAQVNISK